MVISWSQRTVAMLGRALPRCQLTFVVVHLETIISGLTCQPLWKLLQYQSKPSHFFFMSFWKGWTETYRITWRMFTTNSFFQILLGCDKFLQKAVSVVCGSPRFVCILKITVWFICCLSEVQSSPVQLWGCQPSLERQNHPAFRYKVLHPVVSWNCHIFPWESKIIDITTTSWNDEMANMWMMLYVNIYGTSCFPGKQCWPPQLTDKS